MKTNTLSNHALDVINNYLHLPFHNQEVNCPYYNNRRPKIRAGLRALIGKGSVADILEEAMTLSRQERINLESLSSERLKQFLVNHNIGIDCSALAYYILDAELTARGQKPLKHHLKLLYLKNPLRKLIAKFRFIEQVDVATLAHEANSAPVSLKDARPGDMIVLMGRGKDQLLNHVLIIHQIDIPNNLTDLRDMRGHSCVYYTHSLQWSADGHYGHGVRQGTIVITDVSKPLLEHRWIEQGKQGEKNETWVYANTARLRQLRRLRVFDVFSF